MEEIMQDRLQLRQTFDQDAQLYDEARPGYPEALFDDIALSYARRGYQFNLSKIISAPWWEYVYYCMLL
jgi:hypothetical protein